MCVYVLTYTSFTTYFTTNLCLHVMCVYVLTYTIVVLTRYVCICARGCARLVCVCVRECVHAHVCTYMRARVCTCTSMHTHACASVYMHMYAHTCVRSKFVHSFLRTLYSLLLTLHSLLLNLYSLLLNLYSLLLTLSNARSLCMHSSFYSHSSSYEYE